MLCPQRSHGVLRSTQCPQGSNCCRRCSYQSRDLEHHFNVHCRAIAARLCSWNHRATSQPPCSKRNCCPGSLCRAQGATTWITSWFYGGYDLIAMQLSCRVQQPPPTRLPPRCSSQPTWRHC
ncbi:unnamed protein product [Prunus armeniaca]|uniref:Uncharacterized protein n=1 Tax=Prunus armeniaca TaxID=36596 RepID=A0A6J5WVC5_PRUAR|nr:unnamed protein product [Prunus armeniaca]CAB4303642.1 unnamed protein product [Prunus armeniaca]